jgi:hypothetical protein
MLREFNIIPAKHVGKKKPTYKVSINFGEPNFVKNVSMLGNVTFFPGKNAITRNRDELLLEFIFIFSNEFILIQIWYSKIILYLENA